VSRGICLVIAVLGVSLAQEPPAIRKSGAKPSSPASGSEMYGAYCAVCHGKDGKGGGPAAAALKTPPSDLTTLAKRSGGTFPAQRVAALLAGREGVTAHGSREMPVWGPIFREMSGTSSAVVQQRIANLTKHLETLQQR
jgi:mono/diheme cytochrome c family protein